MIEYDVSGAKIKYDVSGYIVKYDGQREDDEAPNVALWYSCFYRVWKSDKGVVNPLAENWQSLLCVFWKFSLRWWKLCQLSSWIFLWGVPEILTSQ